MIPFYTSNQGKALETRVEAVEAKSAPSFKVEDVPGTLVAEGGQMNWNSTVEVNPGALFKVYFLSDNAGYDCSCLFFVQEADETDGGLVIGVDTNMANKVIYVSCFIDSSSNTLQLSFGNIGSETPAFDPTADTVIVKRISLQ